MKDGLHLYTICWNEELMLPFFFDYYDKYVDQYFVYDDGSDDKSLEILHNHSKVTVFSFPRKDDSYVLSAQKLHNSFWKQSIGKANWVIITAIDEILFHHDLINYLMESRKSGITAIPALGYQMISNKFPDKENALLHSIHRGTPWQKMNKLSIFNPEEIEETGYLPGRHIANPKGNIVFPAIDELLNLHYKYLSKEFVIQRHQELNGKLGQLDKERNFGHKYRWNEDELNNDWESVMQGSMENVLTQHKLREHSDLKERWWRNNSE